MKGVYITGFGGLEKLEYREIADPPQLHGTSVLVRVRAAGLNRADLLQVAGHYAPPPGYSPFIPGMEFAGDVAAIGNEVTAFAERDRVFGITAGEGQAEFVLTEESVLARFPDFLTYAQAAAIPEVFITAHDAISTQAGLKRNESILIHAVGSGVGLAALQLAKAMGCMALGTSRTQNKLDRCSGYALDVPILVKEGTKFSETVLSKTRGEGANVILDLVGASYFTENLASAGMKGRVMLVGLTGGRTAQFDMGVALHKRLTIKGTVLRPRSVAEKAVVMRAFTKEVLPFFADRRVEPNLDKTFTAADVIEAYKYLSSNESFGKVVLEF